MKRDMDLIREILIATEASSKNPLGWVDIEIPGRTSTEIAYHVMLLDDAGLIVGQDLSSHSGFVWKPKTLTWQGHEFLDAARSDKFWTQAKSKMAELGGGVGLSVLHALLTKIAMQAVGLEP